MSRVPLAAGRALTSDQLEEEREDPRRIKDADEIYRKRWVSRMFDRVGLAFMVEKTPPTPEEIAKREKNILRRIVARCSHG